MIERLSEALLLLVVGMGGVLVTLGLLAGLIAALGRADEALNRRRIRRYSERLERGGGPAEDVHDELVAVIAAAVESTLRRRVVVRRIRFLRGPGSAWAVSGRLNIMASHHITKGTTAR